MARKCSICEHPKRAEIEKAMLDGASLGEIAKRFGTTKSSLHRHRKDHVTANLAQAKQAREVANAETVLDYSATLRDKALDILDKAEESKDWTLALRAIRECKGVLKLLAEVSGELKGEVQPQNITLIQITVTESQKGNMQELISRVVDINADS